MRSKLLKASNYVLFLSLCATLSAGLVLEYRLPSGRVGHDLDLLSLSRHDWREVHFICAMAFCAGSLLHLYLNWSWIAKVAAQGNRFILAVSIGLGLLIICLPLVVPLGVLEPTR